MVLIAVLEDFRVTSESRTMRATIQRMLSSHGYDVIAKIVLLDRCGTRDNCSSTQKKKKKKASGRAGA